MKLDINEVYHNYITKIVIFAIFLYKRQHRQPLVYKQSVLSFVDKRLPWKIKLNISIIEKYDLREKRGLILNNLLNGENNDVSPIITISFITPLKEMNMEIDITDEKKYEKYIYG